MENANTNTDYSVGTSEQSYTPTERRRILIGGSLGWGLEFYDISILALVAVPLTADLGMSSAVLGAVFTVQLAATAAGGVLFGWLGDIFGRMRILTWTILLFSVSTGLVALIDSVALLFILRFLTGLGTGGEWALGFSLLNEAWKPRRRGLFGSILQATIWPAYAIAILVAALVGDNWRIAFALGALPALVALYIRLRCPESKQWIEYRRLRNQGQLSEALQTISKKTPMLQIFGRDVLLVTLLGTLAVFGGQYAVYIHISFIPTYLSGELGYAGNDVTLILLISAALFYLAFLAVGWISDKVGRRRVLLAWAALQLVAFVLFAIVTSLDLPRGVIVGAYFLIAFGTGYFAVFGVWFGELYPTRMRASGSSWCYSVGRGVAAFGPLVVGLMANTYGFAAGFSTGAIAVAILLVAAAMLSDKSGRSIVAVE